MTGIGITLEDLGIESEPGFKKPGTGATFSDGRKQYDFTLHRLALGSWRKVRECLLSEAKARSRGDLPLWFLLYWGEVESETEASIKERLSVLRYSWRYRNLFDEYLCSYDDPDSDGDPDPDRPDPTRWGGVEQQPVAEVGTPVSAEALIVLMDRFPIHEHEAICVRLLQNPHLDTHLVSVTAHLLAKQAPWHLTFVVGRSDLPADVIDLILGMEESSAHGAQERVIELEHLDQRTLLTLIGKCDRKSILAHSGCTQVMRDEIERLGTSDSVLSHKERQAAAIALGRARKALASGAFTRAGKHFSLRERLIADAVQANAEIGLYEISELLNTHLDEDDDF